MRITCEACEDGTVWASHHGGNDPNVWAEECTDCGGRGTVKVYCYGCDGEACIAYVWNGKHHYWCEPCYKDSRS
jgi:DnaJ-class molecular chaperone